MKRILLLQATMVLCLSASLTAAAQTTPNARATIKYDLTISNGSQMPISPAAIYTKTSAESSVSVGSLATAGFIQLCQTGNAMTRLSELRSDTSVKFITQTNGPIMPGESRAVEIEVSNPQLESVHFETMYGKSKDACGVSSINSHNLFALKQHVTTEVVQKDNTVSSGAFTEPMLPAGMTLLDSSLCATATDAISCLRELAVPKVAKSKVRFFVGYFPSLITALEVKYGAADVQTLLFPTSGAIQLKLKLKH